MEIKDIKELIELINSSELALFELKQGDITIKMDKSFTRGFGVETQSVAKATVSESVEAKVEQKLKDEVISEKVEKQNADIKEEELYTVTSPMVGTFYGASAPGKPAFVSEGSKINKGKILCIIEAMKLMNEIECDVDGEIVKVLLKDGEMVEYGQPLFKVRRA